MVEQAGLDLVNHPPADVLVVADPAALEELASGVALQAVVLLSGNERQASSLQALDLAGWALLPEEASTEQLAAAVNAVAHTFGERPHENTATNLQWLAWLTSGEGLHNNHHAAPTSAKLAFTKREIDPAWPAIALATRLRLMSIRHADLKLKQPVAV